MSLAPYTKTAWVAGSPPGVNLAKLLAWEDGIGRAQHLSGTYAQMTNALAIANPDVHYMATDIGNAFFQSNGATWDPVGIPQLRSTLPGAPYEGQVIHYAPDWTTFPGCIWPLRYCGKNPDGTTNTSTFKWTAVGPTALGAGATGPNNAVAADGTVSLGVAVTLPLAGDYEVSAYLSIYVREAGKAGWAYVWLDAVSTVNFAEEVYSGLLGDRTVAVKSRIVNANAGQVVAIKSATNATVAGTATVFNARRMIVTPIRVG